MELFIVTSYYPHGTFEEAFFETELELLAKSFDKVTLLPLRDLPGLRAVPAQVEVLPPLASVRRQSFFMNCLALPRTWRHVLSALHDAFSERKLSPKVVPNCVKFGCYRQAISAVPRFREFVSRPIGRVVYAYWGHFPAIAALEASVKGVTTCVRYHGGDLYEEQWKYSGHFFPWRKALRASARLNVFVCRSGREYFLRGADRSLPQRCEVHRLGSPDYGRARPRAPTDPLNLVMVSVSSINPGKRVDLIARLAQALAVEGKVIWHHFGSGRSAALDDVLRHETEGLRIVTHGDTPRRDIQNFYRSTDVSFFVNLSLSEGVPVSIMEAINADIPVLATAVGGTPEIVLNGRSGMLIDVDECLDSSKLAARIRRALEPGGQLAISRPREVWDESWDARRNAERFVAVLHDLAAQRHNEPEKE